MLLLGFSRRLLYPEGARIMIFDLATRKSHRVFSVDDGGLGDNLSLSDDQRWIFYTHHIHDADIWLAELE